MKTFKSVSTNIHGEKMTVKLTDGRFYVHHEDCSDDFVTLDEFFLNYIITPQELTQLLVSISSLKVKHFSGLTKKNIKDLTS